MAEITRLVQLYPMSVCHISEALDFLVTTDMILNDSPDLNYILTWTQITPTKALSFFSRKYPNHPIPVQFAIKNLLSYKPVSIFVLFRRIIFLIFFPQDVIIQYIPQIVQAVRHDPVCVFKLGDFQMLTFCLLRLVI